MGLLGQRPEKRVKSAKAPITLLSRLHGRARRGGMKKQGGAGIAGVSVAINVPKTAQKGLIRTKATKMIR